MKFWLTIAALLSVTTPAAAVTCPETDMQSLRAELKGQGETTIVFFASWCSSCSANLTKSHSASTIFVAAFDERKAAEAVADHYKITGRCFTDRDIAETLGVKALPASRVVTF